MAKCCNGCLHVKTIVNEIHGYCQYCNDNRKHLKEVKDILQEIDDIHKPINIGSDNFVSFPVRDDSK